MTDERIPTDPALSVLYDFAYGAGHELNNPLATISARAQLLLRDEKDPERRRMLGIIVEQTDRAHAMIADLMDYAKPPALEPAQIAISSWWRDATAVWRALAEGRGIEWQEELIANVPQFTLDPARAAAAIQAVLRNFFELSPTPRTIRCELSCNGSGLTITLSNDGPPLVAITAERLFHPFYSGREAGRGLGFGLCKSRRIMDQHGGTIIVDQSVTTGVRFVLHFPATGITAG